VSFDALNARSNHRSLVPEARIEPRESTSEWRDMAAVMAAADDVAACSEPDDMLRCAVELARERIGLERVGLYLHDSGARSILMRGTWGTGPARETTDERGLSYECSPADYQALGQVQENGGLWMYLGSAPLVAVHPNRSVILGQGWLVITPLIWAREVVGVMYNDAALSQRPVDEHQQARAAVFCRLLAALVKARQDARAWPWVPQTLGQSPAVRRVLEALREDPLRSGERLARELGISPGYLARTFKQAMGMSLVEYRNRWRLERFASALGQSGGTLERAAREAGFGSYAQFHRVHRQLTGTPPRERLRRPPGSSDRGGSKLGP
jgi:methylphosphotriester-DNA--protein-cysteine methyltransferase